MDCLSTRIRYKAYRPEYLVLNVVGFTVLWLVHNVSLLLKCFDQRGAGMIWISMIDYDVFCFTVFGKI